MSSCHSDINYHACYQILATGSYFFTFVNHITPTDVT